ncbi:gliding motility-associated C-terminal domain-containing protein [Abyssalbus ytuae]|uniref:Gliding motility-associated C-terminal domain-containing protein n=1 Tax=Abyssalbus ytuae TaxID=2926907 RepID=A0A9E7CSJ2_9FLAO|nr:gliding motility-associated C-terminal domain-containing protein [Abyssalbus ytuae]UOB16361.1 gliding motility-associated C-terminal domain-containing protein [Abyssalbus ytuae]
MNSQCAGTDSSVIICDKESDSSLESYNLFAQLGGTPASGGTWSANDPINAPFINSSTGEINLWLINRFGPHSFTYTNSACGESATVTVNLGGYPGEDNVNGGANACSDETGVNLFSFLDNIDNSLSADQNGLWEEGPLTSTGYLTGQFFNAEAAGPGTYYFTYTVSSVETCPEEVAQVILEVHRAPRAGTALDFIICENDDMSVYTNLNLFDRLIGEDGNGVWADLSFNSTNQITDPYDSTINVEEIYNNFGPGIYQFSYTVYPTHGICNPEVTIVKVIIGDISGRFNAPNYCLGTSLNVSVFYQNSTQQDARHDLEYEIRNVNTNDLVFTDNISFIPVEGIEEDKDTLNITINPNPVPAAGLYTIQATNISNIQNVICASLSINSDNFLIYDPQLALEEACIEGSEANIIISNIIDSSGLPSNGTHIVDYEIADLINKDTVLIENQIINFVNGVGSLPVNISAFPVNAYDYNLKFITPSSNQFSCINFDFSAAIVPENIELGLVVDNECDASSMQVAVDAPQLPNGQYTVTYEVREVSNSDILLQNTIVFSGGQANYNVDIAGLDVGDYTVTLRSSQNDTHPCRTEFDFESVENFSIGGAPEGPVLNANQIFCLSDYAPNGPTLADIIIDVGENLTWYEDETSTAALDPATLLIDGEDYYVTSTSSSNNCQSSARVGVVVAVVSTGPVTTTESTQVFCSSDDPVVANLTATTSSGQLVWYDSETSGNALDPSTPLVNATYYAVENVSGCESSTRLQVNVIVVDPPVPILTGENLFCALESPTIQDLQDIVSTESDYEIVWYDTAEGNTILNLTEELQEGEDYYAAGLDPVTGCESKERLEIIVSLTDCNPEAHDFFIPGGFSPNSDGRNDLFYIPNIEFIYPDYTLEIFNRYGQSLFKGNKNKPAWDGTNNGAGESTSGVYFYILHYNKNNLGPKQGKLYLSK